MNEKKSKEEHPRNQDNGFKQADWLAGTFEIDTPLTFRTQICGTCDPVVRRTSEYGNYSNVGSVQGIRMSRESVKTRFSYGHSRVIS